jgi:predicted RNA-binding Zn-ribbon protein involved in translation (DUF1610 family)
MDKHNGNWSEDNGKPKWASKVSTKKIRQLYEADAQGICDPELIDDVGWALWQRCDSILTVTAAHNGHVRCPVCGEMIERKLPWSDDEFIQCTKCGWTLLWADYHQTYRGKQLFGANAVSIFEVYYHAFPKAEGAKEKMLLIDQLIHAFLINAVVIGRPAAANLIEGSLKDVIQFLDQLTSSDASAARIGDSRTAWKKTLQAADWSSIFLGDKRKK